MLSELLAEGIKLATGMHGQIAGALALVVVAGYHLRDVLAYGTTIRFAVWAAFGVGAVLALATASGVIKGWDIAPLLEFAEWIGRAVGSAVGLSIGGVA